MQTQLYPIDIHSGLNTGVDPKMMQQGLTRGTNCILTRQGSIEKRPGLRYDNIVLNAQEAIEMGDHLAVFDRGESFWGITKQGNYLFKAANGTAKDTGTPTHICEAEQMIEANGLNNINKITELKLTHLNRTPWQSTDNALDYIGVYSEDNGAGKTYFVFGQEGKKLDQISVNAVYRGCHFFSTYNDTDASVETHIVRRTGVTLYGNRILSINDESILLSATVTLGHVSGASHADFDTCFIDSPGSTENAIAILYQYTKAGTGLAYQVGLWNGYASVEFWNTPTVLDTVSNNSTALLCNIFHNGLGQEVNVLVSDVTNNRVLMAAFDGWAGVSWASASAVTCDAINTVCTVTDTNLSYASGYKNGSDSWVMVSEIAATGVKTGIYTGTDNTLTKRQVLQGHTLVSRSDGGFAMTAAMPYNGGANLPNCPYGYFLWNLAAKGDFPVGKFLRNNALHTYGDHLASYPIYGLPYLNLDTYTPGSVRSAKIALPAVHTDMQEYYVEFLDIKISQAVQNDQFDGNGLIGGSIPLMFNKGRVFETAFLDYPYAIKATAGATTTANGNSWGYAAMYSWMAPNGRVMYSRPSPVDSITSVINSTHNFTATVFVGQPAATYHGPENRVFLFRTKKNGTDYYLIDSASPAISTGATVEFNDSLTDGSVSVTGNVLMNWLPVNQSGQLASDQPDGGGAICVAFNRIFMVDSLRGSRIYYTKELGEVYMPDFSDDSQAAMWIDVPSEGGKIVALKQIDDKLVIFKERAIYVTYGTGKDPTGAGDGYADPILVTRNYGLLSRRSIAHTQDGLMFHGNGGILLLTRSLEIAPIGEPVKYYIDERSKYGTASVYAINDQHRECCYFLCNYKGYTSTDRTIILYYNTRYKFWSNWQWKFTDPFACGGKIDDKLILPSLTFFGAAMDYTSASAKVASNLSYADKKLYAPSPIVTAIDMVIETGWLTIPRNHTKMRVKACNIDFDSQLATCTAYLAAAYDYVNNYSTVTVAVDFQTSYNDYYGTTESASVTTYGSFEAIFPRQKCQSIRLRLKESSQTKGLNVQGLSLEVGVQPGAAMVDSGKAAQ